MNIKTDGSECHNCSDWDRGRRALIESLLSDEAINAGGDAVAGESESGCATAAESAIRAAIAHVTGEQL